MDKYKDFGFSDTKEMLKDAYDNRYAIPSLNYITEEQLNAIIDAILENNSPTIIMVSPKHCRQFETGMLVRMAQAGVERLRQCKNNSPVALHLDHGTTFEECKLAIDNGFSSVMIDGSRLSLEDNIKLTKKVVDYAHPRGAAVEGEVGALSGFEDLDEKQEGPIVENIFTDPEDAKLFMEHTGADCLAVSVGTIHGLNKSIADNLNFSGLRYDIIRRIEELAPDFPLVLHGCSALPEKYVKMFRQYNGKMETTVGVPDESIMKASKMAVCKINIASDGWIPSTAITRKVLAEHPEVIDSRLYRQIIRKELKPIYQHKMDICGSSMKTTARQGG